MSIQVNYGPMTEIQMQPEEVEYISGCIKNMGSDGLMVEWGSGGSSVKWLETMVENQKLVSIEHNPSWHMKVSEYINTRPEINSRFTYMFKPELFGYEHEYSLPKEENPYGLDDYMWPKHPRIKIAEADIYLIDGIGRATTALLVKMLSLKEDPVVFIHDYYGGRENWYGWAGKHFSKVEKIGRTLARLYK